MAAYRRLYESHHLQADWKEPRSAPEHYTRQLRMGGQPVPFGEYQMIMYCDAACESLQLGGVTFTAYDLGGHERGLSDLAHTTSTS